MPIYEFNEEKSKNNAKKDYRVIVSYTNQFGQHKKKEKKIYGVTKRAAKEFEKEFSLQVFKMSQNDSIHRDSITLDDVATEYFHFKKQRVRLNTYDGSIRKYENQIKPVLGKVKMSKLNKNIISDFKKQLCTKNYTLKYCQNVFGELHALLEYAFTNEYIKVNYAAMVGNFKKSNVIVEADYEDENLGLDDLKYYTLEEVNIFSSNLYNKAARTNNIEDWNAYVFFEMIFFLGLRKEEAYGMRWSRILDDFSYVYIRKCISQNVQGVRNYEHDPKNKSSVRKIPICKRLKKVLQEHYERYKEFYGFQDSWFVVGGLEPTRNSTLSKIQKQVIREEHLHDLTIHQFRHSFATLLINHNVNVKVVSTLMGHSSIKMTMDTYGHLYKEKTNEAITKIDELTEII